MIISSQIMDVLNNSIENIPPETGGIIGGDGRKVTEIVIDKKSDLSAHCCSYSPNAAYLNDCIDKWYKNNVVFMGMFHTHFVGVRTLSVADEEYINKIMQAMPDNVQSLFFPIYVLPNRELVSYLAKKTCNGIEITEDELLIV